MLIHQRFQPNVKPDDISKRSGWQFLKFAFQLDFLLKFLPISKIHFRGSSLPYYLHRQLPATKSSQFSNAGFSSFLITSHWTKRKKVFSFISFIFYHQSNLSCNLFTKSLENYITPGLYQANQIKQLGHMISLDQSQNKTNQSINLVKMKETYLSHYLFTIMNHQRISTF